LFNMQYSSVHDCEDWGVYFVTASGSPTFSNNVTWNLNSAAAGTQNSVFITITSGTPVIDSNIFMKGSAGAGGIDINLNDIGLTFTNNRVVGSNVATGNAVFLNESSSAILGTFSGNVVHGSGGLGIYLSTNVPCGTLSTLTIWRCSSYGLQLSNTLNLDRFNIASPTMFGNVSGNIRLAGAGSVVQITDAVLNGEASYSVNYGIYITGIGTQLFVINSSLGASTAHAIADVQLTSSHNTRVYLINTTLGTPTEVANTTSSFAAIYGHKMDGTGFRNTYLYGTVQAESSIRHTASGYAWKLTPNSATYKLIMPGPLTTDTFKAAVASGAAVTVTAWVVRDSSNVGNAPRLVLVGDIVAGIDVDVTDAITEAAKTITGATNASPIVITSAAHGYADGDRVLVDSVGGNTAANGSWTVANKADNTFELAGSTGNGDYTSGGKVTRWEQLSVGETPSEAGVIEFYVDCDGTAGNVYVDDVAVSQA